MADSAFLLMDDEQDSCTLLSDLIWDLDDPESGPGTAGARVMGFVAKAATMWPATQANIRQGMPMPVDLGLPILPIKEVAGGP
jgi:hypothetical protein